MTELSPSSGWQKLLALFDHTEQHLKDIPLENPDTLEALRSVLMECRRSYEDLGNAMPEIAAVFSGDQIPASIGLEITGSSGEIQLSSFVDAARTAISTFESQTVPNYIQQKIQALCQELRKKIIEINISLKKLQDYQVKDQPIKNAHMLLPAILKRKQEEAATELRNQVRAKEEKITKKRRALEEAQKNLAVAEDRLQQKDTGIVSEDGYRELARVLERMIAENRTALLHERKAAFLQETGRSVTSPIQSNSVKSDAAKKPSKRLVKQKKTGEGMPHRPQRRSPEKVAATHIADFSSRVSTRSTQKNNLKHAPSTSQPVKIPSVNRFHTDWFSVGKWINTEHLSAQLNLESHRGTLALHRDIACERVMASIPEGYFVMQYIPADQKPPAEHHFLLRGNDTDAVCGDYHSRMAPLVQMKKSVSDMQHRNVPHFGEEAVHLTHWAIIEMKYLSSKIEASSFSSRMHQFLSFYEAAYEEVMKLSDGDLEKKKLLFLLQQIALEIELEENIHVGPKKLQIADLPAANQIDLASRTVEYFLDQSTFYETSFEPLGLEIYFQSQKEKGRRFNPICESLNEIGLFSMHAQLAFRTGRIQEAKLIYLKMCDAIDALDPQYSHLPFLARIRKFIPSLWQLSEVSLDGQKTIDFEQVCHLPNFIQQRRVVVPPLGASVMVDMNGPSSY